MRGRKQWLSIDVTTLIIHKVHKIWENHHIARPLVIDKKEAFNYFF